MKTTKYELSGFGGWITIEESDWMTPLPESYDTEKETVYKVRFDCEVGTVETPKQRTEREAIGCPKEEYIGFLIMDLIKGEIRNAFLEHAKNE